MAERIPFRVRLTGGSTQRHEFGGYDGYTALAGVARTLSLAANYTETGKIRQRGDYVGRNAVIAKAPSEGSVVVELFVILQNNPGITLGLGGAVAAAPTFYSLVKRIIQRNTRPNPDALPQAINALEDRSGDLDTLVSVAEPPLRQAHQVIDSGANRVTIVGGANALAVLDRDTREWIRTSVPDPEIMRRQVSVSAFNVNSGSGSVYDRELGRNVAIQLNAEVLAAYRGILAWGLDQYANRLGGKITIVFTRVLAADGRPKKYLVQAAKI